MLNFNEVLPGGAFRLIPIFTLWYYMYFKSKAEWTVNKLTRIYYMITSSKKLSKILQLNLKGLAAEDRFVDFPLQVPESFVARIMPKDINDPLLLQVLPSKYELDAAPGFSIDPLMEKKYSPVAGLIHKYHGRVLLLVTNNCAVNCRFCFRRYSHEKVSDWQKVFSYIKNDPTITEVILSGGDPLMLKPRELKEIMDRLAAIHHVARIRIHTRVPIVMPERITAKLLKIILPALCRGGKVMPLVLVVHCNHPNEINIGVVKALTLLYKQKIPLFNQSVLLHKVNDDSATLVALSEKLFSAGVIPCYLHLLDKVKGAAHFQVNIAKAKRIYLEMQMRLPGYLVPKLVMEVKNRKKYV